MRIGIDIDGVLYPWDECARDALVKKFGIVRPGPSLTWTYLKDNIAPEHWAWLWTAEGQDASFCRLGRTYPGVVAMVEALTRDPDNRVHFVTHRDPRRTAILTGGFLERNFGRHPWAGLHVVQNNVKKRTLARWDVFIDDKPETVFDFLANTNARVFSPVRPWNEDEFHGLFNSSFVHYSDPAEVVEWLR